MSDAPTSRVVPAISPGAAVAAERLGHAIKRAEQAMIARKTRVLRRFGLTVPQYAALLLLASMEGMSAAQLARECMVTPQTMATILLNLERGGLIERHGSALHQKVVVNALTARGRSLVEEADEVILRVEGALSAAYSDTERAAFDEFLERSVTVMNSLDEA
ncbi:MarR family winged helix-turn-helix transcriptional regulator [Frankia sp. QA3]|uniref:MarR family winged helix-turn-helix transcriptional regulator n=1 Tax=Frankia sp. QA3 TaxID=710111 RepID=UPI000269C19C|nr:MarR family transcriptional regulator [Frankia sp. QA3]EIV92578.1 transcriptional regulator [Frankia sp. QA3]